MKEYRPINCLLFYDCDFNSRLVGLKLKLKETCSFSEEKKIFFTQSSRYVEGREAFCRQLLDAVGIFKDTLLSSNIEGILTRGVVGYRSYLEILIRPFLES